MRATILAALAIGPMFAETHTVYAERYYSSFHNRHAVLKRIRPGDTVITRTLDAGGQDEKGARKGEPGNPQTGPFYIEGAEPGDAIAVRFDRMRLNRNWGWSGYRLGRGWRPLSRSAISPA